MKIWQLLIRIISVPLLIFFCSSPIYANKGQQSVIISERYSQAQKMAFELHQKQTRKGTNIPYLSHLESVAAIVWKNGGTETEAIAALLHDAAEDQGGLATLELIRSEFGDEVAKIVEDCSDTFETPKPDWLTRKQRYIDGMPHHSASARLVAAADKLDNLRDMSREHAEQGEKMWEKFTGTKQQTIWYFRTLGNIFVEHGPKNLGKEILAQLAILEAQTGSV